VVIFNNRRYRILDVEMQRTGATSVGPRANDMLDIGRPDIDWVRVGESMGVESMRARTTAEFLVYFRAAMQSPGPRLIEAWLPG